ncbi:MAG: BamA/TamA family outer membrane protein [Acidobacteria bacterium]|nr:BamA/TamA family outer membrane protein [Acidobacteriota bacterium]MBI3486660.1 BamA/TamA family outer membrane protein [Acidobacteriota bacterium]
MLRTVLSIGLLALATAGAREADSPIALTSIKLVGGNEDDRRLAMAALGLKQGQTIDAAAFQQALTAVRLVDRYQSVDGGLGADGAVTVTLIPLMPVASWTWEGDALPKPLKKTVLPELRSGLRLGGQRRTAWMGTAEQRLKEAGYPSAKVQITVEQEGRHARLKVALGTPSLIKEIRLEGDPSPYTRESLLKVAALRPGVSLWTQAILREAHRRLRQRLVKDDRIEGTVRLESGAEPGVILLEVHAGPKVKLKGKGLNPLAWLWRQPTLDEFVPLARADRYAPSLLDEGAGKMTTYFRNQGYPEVKVHFDRVVTAGTPERPEAVTITYTIEYGPQRVIGRVLFEGNRELTEEELRAVAALPRRWFFLPPHAKADAVKAIEDRVTACYQQRGFPDVRVRRRVETAPDGAVEVRLIIREGAHHFLDALVLEMPADPVFPRKALAQSLLLALADHPVRLPGGAGYRSDRRQLQGITGTMETTPEGMRLNFQPALPLVRNDLALVVSDLRQRLSSAGAAVPQVKLAFEEDGPQPLVRIQIPPQPMDRTKRLVVQGADRTRAEAVLREMEVPPGTPLDPAKLDDGQIQLGSLGAFQRVDLLTLKDLPGQEGLPWERGDLAVRLQERSPWVFGESFGYDNTQGYHFGLNAQRLNVGGMGRSWDFGIRAGDQTLRSEALRKAFPTGEVKRSLDSYSVGYTDPWFLPGALDSLLSPRTRLHFEGAYIEEAQAAFFAHRRRFTPSLEWKISPFQTVQFGYRFERVDVASNTVNGVPLISDQDLLLITKTPARSIISAPYLQVTVDRRDKPFDPTNGTYFSARLEMANQLFLTSANSSFVKLDLRHQWNWPVGFNAENGVVMLNLRVGVARPTARSAEDLPLSERFFGGGSFTVRGVEPDMLGYVYTKDSQGNILPHPIPNGGQGLAVVNLEYRFPLFGQSVWAEVFVDSGQVYRTLHPVASDAPPTAGDPAIHDETKNPFPPLRTTLGAGLILKFGFPLKLEYAADWKRILGRPRTEQERLSQLKSLLISAGFQF